MKRADLGDLHFRNLRHAAATFYDELGVTHTENQYMLGHQARTTTDRYDRAEIERIRAKLDVGAEDYELPKNDAGLEEMEEYLASPIDDYDEWRVQKDRESQVVHS